MSAYNFANYAQSSVTSQTQPTTALVASNQQAFRNNGSINNCVLFIFSPQDISDNYVRPTRYNFDHNFADTARDVLNRSQNNAAQLAAMASTNQTLATSILPDSNVAYHVNTHRYSERSTYLMVINSSVMTSNSGVVTGSATREIITGWIESGLSDVINRNTGSVDVNMILNPTHYTKYSLIPTGGYGNSNYGGMRAVCDVDVDLVRDDQINAIDRTQSGANRNWYNLSMSNSVRQTGIMNGMSGINLGDGVAISNTYSTIEPICTSSSAEVMSTRDKDSSVQVADLMVNVNNLITEQVSNGRRSNTINTDSAQLAQLGAASYCAVPVGTTFDPTLPLEYKSLQAKFGPALSVIDCQIPYNCAFDRTDKGARTPHNLACTMITNAMPNILSMYSLSQISFSYDSSLMNQNTLQNGVFYWHNFTPVVPFADGMYANQISLLESSLRSTILAKIVTVFGHFRCNVLASIYRNTVINMYLYDHSFSATDAYFDTNNILGGLNTPLIGSITDLTNNAANISTITQGVINPTVASMSGVEDSYY